MKGITKGWLKLKETTKRRLKWTAVCLVIAWIGFVGFVDWAMHQPPEVFGHVMAHMPMPAYFLFPFETMCGPCSWVRTHCESSNWR